MSANITYRHVLAKLATGPIYDNTTDADYWTVLQQEEPRVRTHFADMGLELLVDRNAKYAHLRQQSDNESVTLPLPRILRRTPLSYHQTLFMILLREGLLRHEQSSDGEVELFYDEEQIRELLRPFFRETTNQKRFHDQVRALIHKMESLNLLSEVKNRSQAIYKVEQIVKAKLPMEQINEIRQRLNTPPASPPIADQTSPTSTPSHSSDEPAST